MTISPPTWAVAHNLPPLDSWTPSTIRLPNDQCTVRLQSGSTKRREYVWLAPPVRSLSPAQPHPVHRLPTTEATNDMTRLLWPRRVMTTSSFPSEDLLRHTYQRRRRCTDPRGHRRWLPISGCFRPVRKRRDDALRYGHACNDGCNAWPSNEEQLWHPMATRGHDSRLHIRWKEINIIILFPCNVRCYYGSCTICGIWIVLSYTQHWNDPSRW